MTGGSLDKDSHADLQLCVDPYPAETDEGSFRTGVLVSLVNRGRGIAYRPALTLNISSPWQVDERGLDGHRGFNLPPVMQAFANGRAKFVGGVDSVIHPHTRLDLCKLNRGEHSEDRPESRVDDFLKMEFVIRVEGCDPVSGTYRMDSDQFYRCLSFKD